MEISKEKKMIFIKTSSIPYQDYLPAHLSTGKTWYIAFSVRDPQTGKMHRKRQKLNHIPLSSRKKIAKMMMAEINSRLALGWNPFVTASNAKSMITLENALDMFLKIKGKEAEENTMRSYNSYVKSFRKWLGESGISTGVFPGQIDRMVAMSFMESLDDNDKISPRTYNNYLSFLQILFNWMTERGFISENPFAKIPKKPKKLTKKKRRLFTPSELNTLISYLSRENPEYLAACLFCYGCLMRPKEIVMIKWSDINLDGQLVHIRSEVAKNDKDSYRTIPDSLVQILKNLNSTNRDNYVFGFHDDWDFKSGPKKMCSRKLASYWSRNVRLACGFSDDLQFYSLKDTGITDMLNSGVPVNLVQQQADHSSLAMTSIYVGKSQAAVEQIKRM